MIRSALKSNPFVHKLGIALKNDLRLVSDEINKRKWKQQRKAVIQQYLNDHHTAKLHIGSGPMQIEGWLNTDLIPKPKLGIIFLDITENLPFDDSVLDFIYSEHLIEHVPLDAAIEHLNDCYRVLKTGGVIRIATPDLKFLLDYFTGPDLSEVQQAYMDRIVGLNHPTLQISHPSIVLNRFVRDWGHQFVYDEGFLRKLLTMANYGEVARTEVYESQYDDLRGLEKHGSAISNDFNMLQTMVLEAKK